jgi:mannose-1-phosphate guanylyltransferase/mannose-6-phosphate isomerase
VQKPCIVANEEHRFTVVEQLRDVGLEPARVLLEPFGRNTAPALQLAALEATRGADDGADPILVVTPADHAIARGADFTAAIRAAVRTAATGGIVVLGIQPERPDTGYGYIRAGAAVQAGDAARPVAAFVEKPDLATAQRYVADGSYYWNGGIFVLRASVWLDALRRFRPDIATASEAAFRAATTDGAFLRFDSEAFAAIPSGQHRLRRHGAGEPARLGHPDPHGAARRRLERPRRLGCGLAGRRAATATATPCTATRSCASRATRSCTPPADWSA